MTFHLKKIDMFYLDFLKLKQKLSRPSIYQFPTIVTNNNNDLISNIPFKTIKNHLTKSYIEHFPKQPTAFNGYEQRWKGNIGDKNPKKRASFMDM